MNIETGPQAQAFFIPSTYLIPSKTKELIRLIIGRLEFMDTV